MSTLEKVLAKHTCIRTDILGNNPRSEEHLRKLCPACAQRKAYKYFKSKIVAISPGQDLMAEAANNVQGDISYYLIPVKELVELEQHFGLEVWR